MRKVAFAATQFACTRDRRANIMKAKKLVRAAAAKGANVVLLQELFETPYFCQDQSPDHFELAAPLEGNPLIAEMAELAKALNVVLPVSFFEKAGLPSPKRSFGFAQAGLPSPKRSFGFAQAGLPSPKRSFGFAQAGRAYFNSLVMIDADGKILGLYRKSHIPAGPGYHEKYYFTPGDTGFRVWHTRFGALGAGICWDQWFPEAARAMALMGAEALLYPTAIGSEPPPAKPIDSLYHWRRAMQGHAAANCLPLVASNRIGSEKGQAGELTFYGSSFVADATGAIAAELGRGEEGFASVTFDLDEIAKLRASWGLFRDRRPDLYGALTNHDGK